MNIEDQVCSLEIAQKLLTLGIKQNSLFYWRQDKKENKLASIVYTKGKIICNDFYSAFTAAELLAILPQRITLPQGEPFNSFRLRMEKSIWVTDIDDPTKMQISDLYIINYYCDTSAIGDGESLITRPLTSSFSDVNLANAVAKALIYVIEYNMAEIQI